MSGKRLLSIAKDSDLMNVSIVYNGEKIQFNLGEELIINEGKINNEIKDQPTYQGFLGLLLVHLNKRLKDQNQELKKIFSKHWRDIKNEKDPSTGRVYSNDSAKEKILLKKDYNKQLKIVNKLEFEVGIIETCLNSFQSRKDLLQSLSANVRKTS